MTWQYFLNFAIEDNWANGWKKLHYYSLKKEMNALNCKTDCGIHAIYIDFPPEKFRCTFFSGEESYKRERI